jgi:phosphoribosyl 1,2-cyclic phosphate phosphodiesterase
MGALSAWIGCANLTGEKGIQALPRDLLTTDIRGQFILLGTGTSVGVPSLGCPCEVCTSTDPHDKRTRCAALVGLPEGNLLIDTPPDLRQQLLREKVGIVHAVFHARTRGPYSALTTCGSFRSAWAGGAAHANSVEERIAGRMTTPSRATSRRIRGRVSEFRRIGLAPFDVLGAGHSVRLLHGPRFEVLGFAWEVCLLYHVKAIQPSMTLLAVLDVLVLDAPLPAACHALVAGRSIEIARRLRRPDNLHAHFATWPERTNASFLGHGLSYDRLRATNVARNSNPKTKNQTIEK